MRRNEQKGDGGDGKVTANFKKVSPIIQLKNKENKAKVTEVTPISKKVTREVKDVFIYPFLIMYISFCQIGVTSVTYMAQSLMGTGLEQVTLW